MRKSEGADARVREKSNSVQREVTEAAAKIKSQDRGRNNKEREGGCGDKSQG